MNILFTICGRAGSKGVPGKNISDFLGYPLVYYTLAAISLYQETVSPQDKVMVALNTDSNDLVSIVNRQSMVPVFVIEREASLAGDTVAKVAVIRDSLEKTEDHLEIRFDIVVDLDITSPIRRVSDIVAAVSRKLENTNSDVVFSVAHARRNPYFNMVKKSGDYYVKAMESDFVSRQQAPEMFDMNASIYAYSPKALKNKEASVFFNSKTDAIVMIDTGILDIDSPEDQRLMSVIAKHFYETYQSFRDIQQRVIKMANML